MNDYFFDDVGFCIYKIDCFYEFIGCLINKIIIGNLIFYFFYMENCCRFND